MSPERRRENKQLRRCRRLAMKGRGEAELQKSIRVRVGIQALHALLNRKKVRLVPPAPAKLHHSILDRVGA